MKYIPYNKKLKGWSRDLRNDSTLSEVLLWLELKAGKCMGYKFNRQKPLLNYIVDFYCRKLALVIEIDGKSHQYKVAYDQRRQEELEKQGLTFLRFDDMEVKRDMKNVMRTIENWILDYEEGNPPGPLGKGE